jgi:hypothetical protein
MQGVVGMSKPRKLRHGLSKQNPSIEANQQWSALTLLQWHTMTILWEIIFIIPKNI